MPFPLFSGKNTLSLQDLDDLRSESQRAAREGGVLRGRGNGNAAGEPLPALPFDVEPYSDGSDTRLAVRGGLVYLPGGVCVRVPDAVNIPVPPKDASGTTKVLMLTLRRDAAGKVTHEFAWQPLSEAYPVMIESTEKK